MMKDNDAEGEFRLWAFHQYYKAYSAESDMERRFVRAIVESAKPVPPGRIEAWTRAKTELAAVAGKRARKEITAEEHTKIAAEAIFRQTGRHIPERAWQKVHPDDVAPTKRPNGGQP